MGLMSISPIDGRYRMKLGNLSEYFSEYALIKKRVYVELMYLKQLGKGDYLFVYEKFDEKEAQKIKEIEEKTCHDLKAVEYYIKNKVPDNVKEFVHYGLTSEDINNLSYGLLIQEFLKEILHKKLASLLDTLRSKSVEHKNIPMLAKTHGQPASPTTVGKEFLVFKSRLEKQIEKLRKLKLTGKLNGAVGNYNALVFAEPERDWIKFSKEFITKLSLQPNLFTTQIEPKDTLVELFQCIKRINNIILDLDRDMWLYISYGYFRLNKIEGEVGSSTMPHKINPIDFENSEGNIKIANALFTAFEDLQVSRLQRDLSDSTMMRNIGVAFSHSMLAYDSTLKGLSKSEPNIEAIEKDLNEHPEVLTEAIQTFLRKSGQKDAYEKLKSISRGENITLDQLRNFIKNLDIEGKDKLLSLEPKDYIGLANKLSSLED
ncbi:MAG: adenylosuccinate lyase [archaeon]